MIGRYLRKRKAERLYEAYARYTVDIDTFASRLDRPGQREFARFALNQLVPQIDALLRLVNKSGLADRITRANEHELAHLSRVISIARTEVFEEKYRLDKEVKAASSWASDVAAAVGERGDPFWTVKSAELALRAGHIEIVRDIWEAIWSAICSAEDLISASSKRRRPNPDELDDGFYYPQSAGNAAKVAASLTTAFARGKPVERYDAAELAGLEASLSIITAQRNWLLWHSGAITR